MPNLHWVTITVVATLAGCTKTPPAENSHQKSVNPTVGKAAPPAVDPNSTTPSADNEAAKSENGRLPNGPLSGGKVLTEGEYVEAAQAMQAAMTNGRFFSGLL